MKNTAIVPITIVVMSLSTLACQASREATATKVTQEVEEAQPRSTAESDPPPLQMTALSFEQWIERFKDQAVAQGVSRATVDRAFQGVSLNSRVIELNQRQPEFTRPIWEYLDGAVSSRRIRQGQGLLNQHRQLLARISRQYQVDPRYLVAIWGLESDFGRVFGGFDVIEALATLAYQGRRQEFGREQLLAALRIVDRGDIPADQMVGSWAGAMGHTQFIPTTFLSYAVDFDGDGRRDLWHSIADALASTANYLSRAGWRENLPWGYEVSLPVDFDWDLSDADVRRPLMRWQHYGVRLPGGQPLPELEAQAALIAPAGHRGPAFLVTDNFRAILRYNNATSYALAVGHLGDRLGGAGPFTASWPTSLEPLSRSDKRELQRLLSIRGYDPGGVDGIIGPRTRAAVKRYQKEIKQPNDGYPTQELLNRLREPHDRKPLDAVQHNP